MSCPECIVALAGFGEDPPTPPMSQIGSDIGTGVTALFVSPVVGSLAATLLGALLWKEHRVLGGLAGVFLGGAAGGVVGVLIAKDRFGDAMDAAKPWEVAFPGGGLLEDSGAPSVTPSVNPNIVGSFRIPRLPQTSATETSDGRQTIVPSLRLGNLMQPATSSRCPAGQTMSNGRCVTLTTKPLASKPGQYSISTFFAKLNSAFKLPSASSQKRVALPSKAPTPLRVVTNTRGVVKSIEDVAVPAVSQQTTQPPANKSGSFSFSASLMGDLPFKESPSAREAWRRPAVGMCPPGYKMFGDGKCHKWHPSAR